MVNRNLLNLNRLLQIKIFISGPFLRIFWKKMSENYLPLIQSQGYLWKQTLSQFIKLPQISWIFHPWTRSSLSITKIIIKTRFKKNHLQMPNLMLMITLNLSLISLKNNQTAKTWSRVLIRLTLPTTENSNHSTDTTESALLVTKESHMVTTQLAAANAIIMNALSAARRIGSTDKSV
jgi:hypothetical protein